MGIVEAVAALLGIVFIVLKEIFAARARAREEDKEYKLDQKKFLEILEKAIADYRNQLAKENSDIQTYEEMMDKLRKKENQYV